MVSLAPHESWLWTSRRYHVLCRRVSKPAAMDEHTIDLVRQLCTRIGMVMEDEAETALIWNDSGQTMLSERLNGLSDAGLSIYRLAEAAKVIIR